MNPLYLNEIFTYLSYFEEWLRNIARYVIFCVYPTQKVLI